jgi:hypothetical protein
MTWYYYGLLPFVSTVSGLLAVLVYDVEETVHGERQNSQDVWACQAASHEHPAWRNRDSRQTRSWHKRLLRGIRV